MEGWAGEKLALKNIQLVHKENGKEKKQIKYKYKISYSKNCFFNPVSSYEDSFQTGNRVDRKIS